MLILWAISAAFSPDGTRIVTASADRTAKVWDAGTGAELLTLRGHTGNLTAAAFGPDGSRIVTASTDQTAKVWDARTGAELLTLRGHTDSLTAAVFSPDGSRIVTACRDSTAKIWDAGPFPPPPPDHTPDPYGIIATGYTPPQSPPAPPGHQSRPLASRNAPVLETQTSGPPLPSSVAALLSDLRREGKRSLADELAREIDQAKDAVARFQKSYLGGQPHVIVGRVVGDGLNDASCVGALMPVHSDGYFVGPVCHSGRPVGFRAQGYYPRNITPRGADGTVEDVGLVRLEPVPGPMRASVEGKLVLEGGTGVSQATARLWIQMDLTHFIFIAGARLPRPPWSLELDVQHSGAFAAAELSPMKYRFSFEAPGYKRKWHFITLKPGETLNLGEVVLERPRPIALAYRAIVSPPFAQGGTVAEAVLYGDESGIGEMFDQKDGEIRFHLFLGSIADLGTGGSTTSFRSTRSPCISPRPATSSRSPVMFTCWSRKPGCAGCCSGSSSVRRLPRRPGVAVGRT